MEAADERARCRDKKRAWALTKSCYTPPSLWGEHLGYDLAPPVPEDELLKFESLNDIKLPTVLRDYLLAVSRELFIGSYPVEIELDLTKPLKECVIPNGTEAVYDTDLPEDAEMLAGMVRIQNDGCTSTSHLVVKGKQRGSIWSVGLGGDALYFDAPQLEKDSLTYHGTRQSPYWLTRSPSLDQLREKCGVRI